MVGCPQLKLKLKLFWRLKVMSNLKSTEKIKLEKFFEMGSGYVCDFSDRTFGNFILENTGVEVYTDEYAIGGTSKANRLRTFWEKESNYLTAKLISEMIEYWKSQKIISDKGLQQINAFLYQECLKIVTNLQERRPIEDINVLNPNSTGKDFALLADSIRVSIEREEPDQAIDRLHTFLVKYIRALNTKHAIEYNKETPLHSLFGGYIKFLQKGNFIESEMSQRILKMSISILEAFNTVRNNQSFAHDNQILNYHESVLIFNNILNMLRFIEFIEHKVLKKKEKDNKEESIDKELEDVGDSWIQMEIDRERGK